MSTIAENIANIRARMNEAAKKAGRDPSEILLCAATKMNDADRVKGKSLPFVKAGRAAG